MASLTCWFVTLRYSAQLIVVLVFVVVCGGGGDAIVYNIVGAAVPITGVFGV